MLGLCSGRLKENLLNFAGALFGVRQHGGVGCGEILQLPTPRSSYSSIDLRTSPPPVEGGCRLATTANQPRRVVGLW